MYDSDRGIEEMLHRLGPQFRTDQEDDADFDSDSLEEDDSYSIEKENQPTTTINVEWLAEQMRTFVDLNPQWEDAIGRFASQLARADDSQE
jgi:hypothetical protein